MAPTREPSRGQSPARRGRNRSHLRIITTNLSRRRKSSCSGSSTASPSKITSAAAPSAVTTAPSSSIPKSSRHSSSSSGIVSMNGAKHSRRRSTLAGGITARRSAHNPEFRRKLEHMSLPLAPLVQMNTGAIHPSFPSTILHFWLLTEQQLDDIAHFYHQRTPSPWSQQYPCPVVWADNLTMEDKRRKIGKFIGLRGCQTPTVRFPPASSTEGAKSPLRTAHTWLKTQEQIEEEARRAALEADSEEAMRKKLHWYQ